MDRWDFFRLDGRRDAALDLHCVRPGCSCREVRMTFSEVVRVDAEERSTPVWELRQKGTFLLTPPCVEPEEIEPEGLSIERLLVLWRAYRDRHRHRNLLAIRDQKLKALGPELVALSRRQGAGQPIASPDRPGATSSTARTAASPNAAGTVGRNDPCPCGSGKKHKKCCRR